VNANAKDSGPRRSQRRGFPETVAVTGGAQGIGFAIANAFVSLGSTVAVLDINGDGASVAAKKLRRPGVEVHPVECDVTQSSSVASAFDEVRRLMGAPDVLINNAGWTPNERFVDSQPATWAKVVEVNYLGVLRCSHHVLPDMIARERGRIVCIASDAARVGTPRQAVYAGAKAAVIGFAKSLAAEVARHGITVNVVCPSSTDTPLLRSSLSSEQIARRIKANPMGRLGSPEDLAAAAVFFASQDASYITGQVLSVNGGSSRLG
jgi:2-hydroxycyclohexanecarboxyl-CoA dehydrogenase